MAHMHVSDSGHAYYGRAWDCDPFVELDDETDQLDEEDASGDWQTIALDRWGDRLINGRY